HIRREIFTFQPDADINLILVFSAQGPNAPQVVLKLFLWIHPHMGTVGAGKPPRTMVGKAQNLIAASNGALHIFLIPPRCVATAGSMGMEVGLHHKSSTQRTIVWRRTTMSTHCSS